MDKTELIDSEVHDAAAFSATFRDIARVNRFLGGTQAVLAALAPLIRNVARAKLPGEPVRILDIGTGSADIPRSILHASDAGRIPGVSGCPITIHATDTHSKVLAIAKTLTPPSKYPSITIGTADALKLPFADGAFDIALCSMMLHHFGPDDCVRILREMDRVTTAGFVVNDLIRSRRAASLVALWTRLTFAHRLTKHDAPTSVMRAYLIHEYAALAAAAGLVGSVVRRVPLYRAVIIHPKSHPAGSSASGTSSERE
ncbi:MAG: methyltransferase domain-containing protein [Cytophagales bacterium]|nr:methyltransferase domain-containing protein [Armatimonadota bacterium]